MNQVARWQNARPDMLQIAGCVLPSLSKDDVIASHCRQQPVYTMLPVNRFQHK